MIKKSIIGLVANTISSVFCVFVYVTLGILIIKKLGSNSLIMSKKTKKLQTQLMKALIVQSVIPTFVSFAPCLASWYQPVFGFELGRFVQIHIFAPIEKHAIFSAETYNESW